MIICTYLSGYVECGQSISCEANSTSKITWKVHSKWLYVWSALETFDKAEFKLLKCIRDEFINSNFHLHSEKSPGYLEVSGRHCEILRSPFPTAGVGLIPESERGKICISNKDIASELSYSICCSVFPPSIAQQTTPRIR